MEIRVARVVRVAAVIKLIFSHTGGYGNTGSKGRNTGKQGRVNINISIQNVLKI